MAQYLDRSGLKVVLQHIKANYAKESEVTSINGKLEALGISDISGLSDALTAAKLSAEVVESLPETGERGKLYLVGAANGSGDNNYTEYVWVESSKKFEKLGDTAVDLSGYVKSGDLKALTVTLNGGTTDGTDKFTYDTKEAKSINITAASVGGITPTDVDTKISAAIAGKVDKDGDKALSTNDYTTDEKNKLAGIAEKATADSAIPAGTESDTAATDDTLASASVNAMINAYL